MHWARGPGLLESAYQACLAHELRSVGLELRCEVPLPVHYGEVIVEVGYRIDMIVDKHQSGGAGTKGLIRAALTPPD